MTGRIEGKVALVTGGASGIGAATVRRFVAEGAKVVFTDIDEGKGAALAAETGVETGAEFMVQDVTDEARWDEVTDHVMRRHGRLDILFNNAGIITGFAPIEEATLEQFQRTIDINLKGVFLGCRAGVRAMRKNPPRQDGTPAGGAIINTSSITGFVGIGVDAPYTASKGAVRLLTKSVAERCARERWNIRCNSLHPGAIDTPILDWAREVSPDKAEIERVLNNMSPTGRMGRAEEIAAMVLFLASDEAEYCTGAEYLVDGGLLCGQPMM